MKAESHFGPQCCAHSRNVRWPSDEEIDDLMMMNGFDGLLGGDLSDCEQRR